MSKGTFMPEDKDSFQKEYIKNKDINQTNQDKQLSEKEKMPGKVQFARIGLLVLGFFVIAFGLLLLLVSTNYQHFFNTSYSIIFLIGIFIVGIFYLITAWAIFKKKIWSKTTGIVLGVLAIPFFPIGTFLGILISISLVSKEANNWFKNIPEEKQTLPTSQPVAQNGMLTGAKERLTIIGWIMMIISLGFIVFYYIFPMLIWAITPQKNTFPMKLQSMFSILQYFYLPAFLFLILGLVLILISKSKKSAK